MLLYPDTSVMIGCIPCYLDIRGWLRNESLETESHLDCDALTEVAYGADR